MPRTYRFRCQVQVNLNLWYTTYAPTSDEAWDRLIDVVQHHHGGLWEGIMMQARTRKQLVRPRPIEEEGNIDWDRDDYDDLFEPQDDDRYLDAALDDEDAGPSEGGSFVIDLSRYLHRDLLAFAEEYGASVGYNADGALYSPADISVKLTGETWAQVGCVHQYLRSPVLVRPPLALCRTLANTELRIPIQDYRQPWKAFGIEWPESILPPFSVTLVWRPTPTSIWVFTPADARSFYHLHVGYQQGEYELIEEVLTVAPLVHLTQEEEATSQQISRMAINLGLLMTSKGHRLSHLPPSVRRRRQNPDPQVRNHARRQSQELIWDERELDMFLQWQQRPKPTETGPGHPEPQFRRGHWKRVAYGPQHSLRKLGWIEPYYTGDPDNRPPTVTVIR